MASLEIGARESGYFGRNRQLLELGRRAKSECLVAMER